MASRKGTRVAALASRYSFRRGRQENVQDNEKDGDKFLKVSSPPKPVSGLRDGTGRGRKRKPIDVKLEDTPQIDASTSSNTDSVNVKLKGSPPKTVKIEVKEEDSPGLQPESLTFQESVKVKLEGSPPEAAKIEVKEEDTGDRWFPPNWEVALNNIRKMRKEVEAPVDTMGCDQCHDTTTSPAIQRYQILISLMLSSQTKDQVTHAAMGRLREHGLTPENIIKTDTKVLEGLIKPVGFYKRKSEYIKKASQILLDQYNGDIPDTLEKLCDLPGVGPKMAHICMNCAWNVVSGIGVDTHVHRISKRIGWLPEDVMKMQEKKRTPEHTRKGLERWLPKPLWSEVNHLLVGFGQTICKPVHPDCNKCLNKSFCPSAKIDW